MTENIINRSSFTRRWQYILLKRLYCSFSESEHGKTPQRRAWFKTLKHYTLLLTVIPLTLVYLALLNRMRMLVVGMLGIDAAKQNYKYPNEKIINLFIQTLCKPWKLGNKVARNQIQTPRGWNVLKCVWILVVTGPVVLTARAYIMQKDTKIVLNNFTLQPK